MFLHDLALELGMTVAELSARMTMRELGDWKRYARQRGFPSRRLQYQTALLGLIVSRLAGSDATSVEEFVVDFSPRKEEGAKMPETAAASGAALGAMAGAGVVRLGQRKGRR